MTDRREEISDKYSQYIVDFGLALGLDNAHKAMDDYMKESCLAFLKYTLEKMGGHSVDAAGNVEVKFNGEWITPEQLFENFL